METPEKFIIFSQKKICLIFEETELPKNNIYISGKGNLKKLLTFQERYIQNPSIKELSYIAGKVYSES